MLNHKEQLYVQIKKYVENMIEFGQLKPDDRIPSENDLTEKFDVSRITVKTALDLLAEEGKVYRMQGKGTFVTNALSDYACKNDKIAGNEEIKNIACILPQLKGNFILNILEGLLSEAESQGYNVIVYKSDESAKKEEEIIKKILSSGIKGIIVYPVENRVYCPEILKLTLNRFPLVVIDKYLKGVNTNVVHTDNFKGAYEATRHLIELGHGKIGFVSLSSCSSSIEDRIKGYEKALADSGMLVEHRYRLEEAITHDLKTEIEQITKYLKSNKDITALLVINNEMGRKLVKGMKILGLSSPGDISLVFFDDFRDADLLETPPTCVVQQAENLGKEAIRLLNRVIEDPERDSEEIIIKPKLEIRSSTGNNIFGLDL